MDATFRIDECTPESARVSIVRGGRTLVRLVPWGDTPDALRVRLVAIVLAELLHTDDALQELSRADRDQRDRSGAATDRSVNAAGHASPHVDTQDAPRQGADEPPASVGLAPSAPPPLVLEAQLGLRIFPPLPLPFADDDVVTLDVGLGVQWRRLLARASVLARSRKDDSGSVRLRAYLGVVGARLIDATEGAWRLQLDLLTTVGVMQARGHFDPRPEDGASQKQRLTGGLSLGLGIAHDRTRARVGFRCELGYLRGMVVDQRGARAATLDEWNVAFYLSVGLRVNATRAEQPR